MGGAGFSGQGVLGQISSSRGGDRTDGQGGRGGQKIFVPKSGNFKKISQFFPKFAPKFAIFLLIFSQGQEKIWSRGGQRVGSLNFSPVGG